MLRGACEHTGDVSPCGAALVAPGDAQRGQPGCAPSPRGRAAGLDGGDVWPKERRGMGAALRDPEGTSHRATPLSSGAGRAQPGLCLLAPRVSSCNKVLLHFVLGRAHSGGLGAGNLGSPAPRHPRSDLTNATGQGAAPRFHPAAACSSASTMVVSPLPAPRTWQGDTASLQDVPLATATVPTDNQSFLVNTDCPVLLLLSHLRSKVGVPATGELRGQRAGPRGGSPWGWHHWDACPGFSRRHRCVRQAGHPQAALPGQDPTGEGQRVPAGARHLLCVQGGVGHPR